MRPKFLLVALAFVGLLMTAGVQAAVPTLIHVQGRLTDANGAPLPAGTATLIFKIFPSPTDTREIWPQVVGQEQHVVTLDANGLWNARLGETHPLGESVFSAGEQWLEVQHVESGVVLPRVQMITTPYSHRITTVDNASGGDIFGDIRVHSDVYIGDLGDPGNVIVRDGTTFPRVKLNGEIGQVEAFDAIELVENIDGDVFASLDRNGSGGGILRTYDELNNPTTTIGSTATGNGGFIQMYYSGATLGVVVDANDGNSGMLQLNTPSRVNVDLDADAGDGGAVFTLGDGTRNTVTLDALGGGGGGGANFYNSNGRQTIELDADENNHGTIRLYDSTQATRAILTTDGLFNGSVGAGRMSLYDEDGTRTVDIIAAEAAGNGAQIELRDGAGNVTINMDASPGNGPGRVTTQVLEITGGADLSEQFNINPSPSGMAPVPGAVVCIDPNHPGELAVSEGGYCRAVAGIVSGAGGVIPGMLMRQEGTTADGHHPVALTGRVYVLADADAGPIEIGDLLTTADRPGHAMRAGDYDRAHGAIIGKAMTRLASGQGLVLVLVNLQ
jgi:hypothetical protein